MAKETMLKRRVVAGLAVGILATAGLNAAADELPKEAYPVMDAYELEQAGYAADDMNVQVDSEGNLFRVLADDALSSGSPVSPALFGPNNVTWTTLAPGEFRPKDWDQQYFHRTGGFEGGVPLELYCPVGETEEEFAASVDLPAGALVTQITLAGFDQDVGAQVSAALVNVCQGSVTTFPTATTVPYGVVRSGTTFGGGIFFGDAVPNFTVGNLFCHVVVVVDLGASGCQDQNLRLQKVRLGWKRQQSPAPISATFTDVPVGAPFFGDIERLAESGITSGCATSPARFCPNSPVTRGQMAAFLSRAFGLNWSNF